MVNEGAYPRIAATASKNNSPAAFTLLQCMGIPQYRVSGTIAHKGLATATIKLMNARLCILLWSSALVAADQGQLALSLKAQSDFDRVALATQPQLSDTAQCMQSQAAYLSVSPPEESALLHYRMGYCALAAGAITHDNRDSLSAAAEFEKAIQNWASWPGSMNKAGKNQPPVPVP